MIDINKPQNNVCVDSIVTGTLKYNYCVKIAKNMSLTIHLWFVSSQTHLPLNYKIKMKSVAGSSQRRSSRKVVLDATN